MSRRRACISRIVTTTSTIKKKGTFEQLESATRRLLIAVPLTLLIVLGLLYAAFGSGKDTLIVFTGVPLALTGGILALLVRGMPLSILAHGRERQPMQQMSTQISL